MGVLLLGEWGGSLVCCERGGRLGFGVWSVEEVVVGVGRRVSGLEFVERFGVLGVGIGCRLVLESRQRRELEG